MTVSFIKKKMQKSVWLEKKRESVYVCVCVCVCESVCVCRGNTFTLA